MITIKEFIEENDLDFSEGSRNTTVVTLVGYAQHIGLKRLELLEELQDEINSDNFIKEETNRLWEYCEDNNYKKFWLSEQAKAQYIF